LGAWVAQVYGLSELAFGIVTGLITGLVVGLAQWVFLRTQVTRAGWWIPASVFAWTSGLVFYQPGASWLGLYIGTLAGIVTGIVILWLIYRPEPDANQPETPG
jgi:hypothetical protein